MGHLFFGVIISVNMCLSNIIEYRAEVEQICFLGLNRLPKEFSNVNCEKKFFPPNNRTVCEF